MTNHRLFKSGLKPWSKFSLLTRPIAQRIVESIELLKIMFQADRPVRAIELMSARLLKELGFRYSGRGVGAGQPPDNPTDLLKTQRLRKNGSRIEIRYVSRKAVSRCLFAA